MITQPPAGSRITIVQDGQEEIISIPPKPRSPAQFLVFAFMIFWLGLWAQGWLSAANQVLTKGLAGAGAFLVFWLCAWTVGGVLVMHTLRASIRMPTPATIRLRSDGVLYDAGFSPIQWNTDPKSQRNSWKDAFKKPPIRLFANQDLTSLKLREADGSNRLTIDVGNERIDLAEAATEIEREWLFEYLAKRYH